MAVRIFSGQRTKILHRYCYDLMNRFCHTILMILILAAIATWCGSMAESSPEAIYRADGIEVYNDSIILDGKEYNATPSNGITGTETYKADSAALPGPALVSGSRMADALFAKALGGIDHDVTVTATDIFLSLALLCPEASMERLRNLPPDGAWAAAAWEVYCVTGDRKWLKESYSVISGWLTDTRGQETISTGIPEYMQPVSDYFPRRMEEVDLIQVRSLGTNTWRFRALEVAALMAGELGLKEENTLRHRAGALREAINDTFWEPAMSCYGQYLYGDMYPILSSASDNYAGALCLIFGIATWEMAQANVESTVTLPRGIPVTYPSLRPEGVIIPAVQALHGIAAAAVHDQSALRQATGTLWASMLSGNDASAWPALLLRGILGISLSPDGITVNPFIPAIFSPSRTLRGLRYRDAVIDITINGTGDRIASATLDGTPAMSAFIPADISGHHTLTITLTGNTLHARELNIAKDAAMPPTPKVIWHTSREATIADRTPDTGYDVYVNGVMTESLRGDTYSVSGGGTQVIDIVPVTTTKRPVAGFSPAPHVCASPIDIISIPASTITPRRSPLHLIRHKETATRYIELAARHNTRLTFYVNAPSAGEYFLHILYSNGTGETAVRTVEVNSRPGGTIVCPPVRKGDWVTTGPSTTITVRLKEGQNKLSLYYVNTTILLNEIKLLKK